MRAPSALWLVLLVVAMAGAAFTNDGPGSRGRCSYSTDLGASWRATHLRQ